MLELAEATVDACGAKAAACGELARVAAGSGGAFAVPWGACLPFGAMEAALQACALLPRPRVCGESRAGACWLKLTSACRPAHWRRHPELRPSICGRSPAEACCLQLMSAWRVVP